MAILQMVKSEIFNNVQIRNIKVIKMDEKNSIEKPKTGKWADFANRMSGLTNVNITNHIEKTHQEMKKSFQFRDLELNK